MQLLFRRQPRIENIASESSWTSPLQTVRTMGLPIGANLENSFIGEHPPGFSLRHASAKLSRTSGVGHELIIQDLQRVFRLYHLDRETRHIRKHTGVAVKSVSPWTGTPGTGDEVDVDEGIEVLVVAADGQAGVAAVRRGEHSVGVQLRQRAKTTINAAESGQPTS